ncbi:MAG: penicillin-binding protein 2, partial [Sphingomonadaceae bacterium]|nr:penicillin-binding protein 2 [Sphingomonadaceae bacterium]
VDAPKYAISVVVEHGEHGAAAAVIARDVMTYLFEPERALATLAPLEAAVAAKKRAALAAAEAAAAGPVDPVSVAAALTPAAETAAGDE